MALITGTATQQTLIDMVTIFSASSRRTSRLKTGPGAVRG